MIAKITELLVHMFSLFLSHPPLPRRNNKREGDMIAFPPLLSRLTIVGQWFWLRLPCPGIHLPFPMTNMTFLHLWALWADLLSRGLLRKPNLDLKGIIEDKNPEDIFVSAPISSVSYILFLNGVKPMPSH